ncbi:MAG: thioredoxin [Chloroflexi bacterium]|nr:thioredoxin [Chloroflexota bacterium]
MSNVQEVTAATFASEVLEAELPALVDMWATWCAPCRMLGPEVEKLAAEQEGRLKVTKLDVQQDAEVAARYGVTSIPTMLLFVNGELKERLTGYMPAARIAERLGDYLA